MRDHGPRCRSVTPTPVKVAPYNSASMASSKNLRRSLLRNRSGMFRMKTSSPRAIDVIAGVTCTACVQERKQLTHRSVSCLFVPSLTSGNIASGLVRLGVDSVGFRTTLIWHIPALHTQSTCSQDGPLYLVYRSNHHVGCFEDGKVRTAALRASSFVLANLQR